MAKITALTHVEIEHRGDNAANLAHDLARQTLDSAAKSLHGPVSVDDLSVIKRIWNDKLTALTPTIRESYMHGATVTRVAQRDALVRILQRRTNLIGAASTDDFEIPLIPNQQAETYLSNATNRLSNVGNEVWAGARDQLVQGLQAGEDLNALKDRVTSSIDTSGYRAELIARTEVSGALNSGELEQMQQVQVKGMTKEWLAVMDARTRPEHAEANGEKVDVDGTFSIGEEPGDAPNCRCTYIFDVPDDAYAESACDCGDGEVAVAASALVAAAGDDLTSVCACGIDQYDKLDTSTYAPHDSYEDIYAQAQEKIAAAPAPSEEAVRKAQRELANARAGVGRAGGESRGGSAAARRKQRLNLYNEFGGEQRGYVPCHSCGIKTHWADPGSPDNPHGYARFERGKIFVKCQGGGYQLANLLPECFGCNRSRNDKMIRAENRC
jgi:SPP1 gp7 family putative phage head morphogenesis protein